MFQRGMLRDLIQDTVRGTTKIFDGVIISRPKHEKCNLFQNKMYDEKVLNVMICFKPGLVVQSPIKLIPG